MQGCAFHKPSYEGRVVEFGSEHPLEGAVVVALYSKDFPGGGGGSLTSSVGLHETTTDKEGRFIIPSFTRLMAPLYTENSTELFFYKPGYGNARPMAIGHCFSKSKLRCIERSFQLWSPRGPRSMCGPGVIKLPRLETREDRLRAYQNTYAIKNNQNDTPMLYKATRQERKFLGMKD